MVERPPEKHNMWLWAMDGIVDPSPTLLYSYRTPFSFREEAILGEQFGHFRSENNMPVLVSVIEILIGILDLTHRLARERERERDRFQSYSNCLLICLVHFQYQLKS